MFCSVTEFPRLVESVDAVDWRIAKLDPMLVDMTESVGNGLMKLLRALSLVITFEVVLTISAVFTTLL
jgi:hypothetical protein